MNRASRKEAAARLSVLRRQVSLQVFTHRFEDSACRETRQAAEELAESSTRLTVEINEVTESVDLLRKYRVDAVPALVITGKDMPVCRLYGVPLAYAFDSLLDAIVMTGTVTEVRADLADELGALFAGAGSPQGALYADLVLSRRESVSVEAIAALWRLTAADRAVSGGSRIVTAVRMVEDFPHWALRAGDGALPALLVAGRRVAAWPFTDLDLAASLLK